MGVQTTTAVGTVEILRMRVYPLDPECGNEPAATSVCVQPGTYPVFRTSMGAYFWLMTGALNERFMRLGDGMFTMSNGDTPSDVLVTFPSQVFGPDEFADLLASPGCTEGDPMQRLRFRLES